MEENRQSALAALAGGQRVYGWNQALGPLKDKELSTDEQRAFQRNTLLVARGRRRTGLPRPRSPGLPWSCRPTRWRGG